MSRPRPLPYSSFDYSRQDIRSNLDDFSRLIANQVLQARSWDQYARHVRNYLALCHRFGLRAFPCTSRAIIAFLTHHLATQHAASSMAGILSALKKEQFLQGWPNFLDQYQEVAVKNFVRASKKMFGVAPRRKRPLTLPILLAMAQQIDLNSPRDQQCLTMAFVAHDGLLRFSELAALKVRDVVWDHQEGTVYLIVRKSKANKEGPPELVALQAYGSLSGAFLLAAYWRARGLHDSNPDDPLFPVAQGSTARSIEEDGRLVPVVKSNFIKWVRRILSSIGLVGPEYSGHSFRSGGATDLWSRRIPPSFIKLVGRWRSEAYAIYCRDHPAESALLVANTFRSICVDVLGPFEL